MRRRGEGQSDIEAVLALTGEELEASIDHADEGDFDWSKATGSCLILPAGDTGRYTNALRPVNSRPTISVLISQVPSKV